MPSGQQLIDALQGIIGKTGQTQPTFTVDVAALRTLLARETAALAQANQRERLDEGRLAFGTDLLNVRVKLTADGSHATAELASAAGVHILIAAGGKGRSADYVDGADAKINAETLGDGLVIALGGHGVNAGAAPNVSGTKGGNGTRGGMAAALAGDGCDAFAYSGDGGNGSPGTAGARAQPANPAPLPPNASPLAQFGWQIYDLIVAFIGSSRPATPAVPGGDGGDGGSSLSAIIRVGSGGFAEGVGGRGGNGSTGGAAPVGAGPGGAGTAGNGGIVDVALGPNSVASPACRRGAKGTGANGANGMVTVHPP